VDCAVHKWGRQNWRSEKKSVGARKKKELRRQRPAENSILYTSCEENKDESLPVNRISLDCESFPKREQLQGAKTLHIFSKISEILMAVKQNLASLAL
jgi:hypothetical protein